MDLNQLYEIKALHAAKTIYVIVVENRKGVKGLAPDPGLERPWSTKNRQLADSHAQDISKHSNIAKAAAMTLEEAFMLLQRDFAAKESKRLGRRN